MNNNPEVQEFDEEEIDLREMFFELLEHWQFIVISTVLMALVVALVNLFVLTPIYQSSAELYILDSSTSISSLADIQIGNNLADDYVQVSSSRPVLDTVIGNLGLEENFEELSKKVSVTNKSGTHILIITVKDANASRAKMIADETARVARAYIADKMGQTEPSILHYGYDDGKKVSPSRTRNTIIGAAGGFVASSGIVVLLWLVNDSIQTEEDVERKLGLTVLGSLPYDEDEDDEKDKRKTKKKKRTSFRKKK